MADQNPQKQVADKLKDVESILVTVNTNPTVDELSAALGFTLLLNKMNKHATAVFSGDIPPAISFLEPGKTFENTVDSLRDFIIALDKEKADHLRYKVDGDMVKIFITPYRTTISQDDLDFSQGDYNVEMVVAIGVKDESDLDRALADHGKIMHDATVASLSIGSESSELGSINWHDSEASSYSEMLVSVAESLKGNKNLIDEQIATAFLTGIVAATERFSNQQTTSKVMTMAAQLMAAGANQQLIATQLEEAEEIPQTSNNDTSEPSQPAKQPEATPKDQQGPDGTMRISHEKSGDVDDVAAQLERENQEAATRQANEALQKQSAGEQALAKSLAGANASQSRGPSLDELKSELEAAKHENDDAAVPPESVGPELSLPTPGQHTEQYEPSMGGTLNATTQEAAEAKLREELSDRNKMTLSHDHGHYIGNPPADLPAINSFNDESATPQPTTVFDQNQQPSLHGPTINPPSQTDNTPAPQQPAPLPLPPSPFDQPAVPEQGMDYEPAPVPQPSMNGPTLAELDAQNRQPHDEARAAIDDALKAGPSTEAQQATVSSLPPTPPEAAPVPGAQEGTELPPLPPMPDFSTLPPLPNDTPEQLSPLPPQDQNFAPPAGSSDNLEAAFPPLPSNPQGPDTPPQSTDPNQFKIPGQ